MAQIFDGFWLPQKLRQELISEETAWVVQYQANGKTTTAQDPEAVGGRWPVFSARQWEYLFNFLEEKRQPIPVDFINRLQAVLANLFMEFQSSDHPFTQEAVKIFSNYSGYSPEMIRFMMSLFDDGSFDAISEILKVEFPASVLNEFTSLKKMNGPEGQIRYYQNTSPLRFKLFTGKLSKPLHFKEDYPQTVLGYASGNVLGTAFIITLLGQISALVNAHHPKNIQNLIPAILVKNSRQEPLFVPFLFSAIEKIDPGLLRTAAIMIWDYEDTALQELIISRADLVMAAAGDHTIQQIGQVINRVKPNARFIQHGHKTSFTTIGKAYLAKPEYNTSSEVSDLFEETAILAALDSILWDQNGCLSSRIHFIEQGSDSDFTALEYGQMLVKKLRILSQKLPRGTIPLSRIHDRFDHFNAQTISPLVQLCSNYEDDFVVVVDSRPWDQQQFRSIVNTCMDRTIVIRPVQTIMEVPNNYLPNIAPNNLQTMYVAINGKGDPTGSTEFSQFIEQIGKRGITSIRTVGQSPFPQLAYSWDGYMPHSLSLNYPEGRFTTIEFDNNFALIKQISQWLAERIL